MTTDHGGRGSRYTAGCRCAACRAANARRHKRRRAERTWSRLPDGKPHNASTYVNWGCRCEVCRAAVRRAA